MNHDIQALRPRLEKELATLEAMIHLHCRKKHQSPVLCGDCEKLRAYARKRLENCPFQEEKPTCGQCPIHCYNKEMRRRVVDVMRFSGPRMILHHPLMALHHMFDTLRNRQKSRVTYLKTVEKTSNSSPSDGGTTL